MIQKEIESMIFKIKKDILFHTIDYDTELTDPNGANLSEIDLAYLYLELKKKYQVNFDPKDLEERKLNTVNGITFMLGKSMPLSCADKKNVG